MPLEIHPMCLGEVVVDHSFLVWAWDQGQKSKIPFTSYLILGGDHPVMVDAGARSVDDLSEQTGLPVTQTAEQTLDAQLAKHGLVPEDVGTLIITHCHHDHTGLVDKVPNARIRVQRSELQYAAAPHFPPGFFDRIDIAKMVSDVYDRIDFDEGDAEIAPGISTIFTSGHSPGHQMVYVELDSGLAIITGDNVYRKHTALPMGFPPGLVHDMPAAVSAVKKIARDGKHILPMHDPVVYDEYPDGVR
jgi:N-acyl homoserine lactone hydrolase